MRKVLLLASVALAAAPPASAGVRVVPSLTPIATRALDEISWNGWSTWVDAGIGSWYDAGVTARQRMAAAGFDRSAGDTWAVNELSSAVRAGTGAARTNALEFLRGLEYDGVKGVVFVQGIGQSTADTTTYKLALQGWLQDDTFWSEVTAYVSDWAQEDYGDLRSYAVAGAAPDTRRDQESQYLGHELALAQADPSTTAPSRAFLDSTYVAFGNAAWAWPGAYGWTAAPVANMEDFVSGQVYAARSLGAPSGVDRFGFAWSPSNTLGLSDADFTTQTGALLDRRAPATFTAGGSTQVTVQLQAAGVAQTATSPQPVTFTTSSPSGTFSPSATVTIPVGASTATVTVRAVITLRVRRGTSVVANLTTRTSRAGTLTWRSKRTLPAGRYAARATVRSASTA